MMPEAIQKLIVRDLHKLRQEIEAYRNEVHLWYVEKGITNSAGNLCLHIVGNLNTYIGSVLGNTGYIRHRDLEFSSKGILKTELLKKIDDTIVVIEKILPNVSDFDLEKEYPMQVLDHKTSTAYMLVHLHGHLNYHLGQINYHRRLFDH